MTDNKRKAYAKYCNKLINLIPKYIDLDGCAVNMLLDYWFEVSHYGKATPVHNWQYLCVRRVLRSDRDLPVTDIPNCEDFIKECE